MNGKNSGSLASIGQVLSHPLLLIIRLYWGGAFIGIGLSKWSSLGSTVHFFDSLGIPLPGLASHLVAAIEFFGGIALVLGLFSRFFSLLLIGVMIGAFGFAHQEALASFFSDPQIIFKQSPFLFLYACLIVFCFGPGKLSADGLIGKN